MSGKIVIALALLVLGMAALLYVDALGITLQADTRSNLQMLVNGAFAALGYGVGRAQKAK